MAFAVDLSGMTPTASRTLRPSPSCLSPAAVCRVWNCSDLPLYGTLGSVPNLLEDDAVSPIVQHLTLRRDPVILDCSIINVVFSHRLEMT